jgi:hypothetical protein
MKTIAAAMPDGLGKHCGQISLHGVAGGQNFMPACTPQVTGALQTLPMPKLLY